MQKKLHYPLIFMDYLLYRSVGNFQTAYSCQCDMHEPCSYQKLSL